MNAERLHTVAKLVQEEINSTSVIGQLQQLQTLLQQLTTQPNAPQFQQQMANTQRALFASLMGARSNTFRADQRQILDELGATSLLGNPLRERLENIFARNPVAIAQGEIRAEQVRLATFKTAIDQMLTSFQTLKFPFEEIKPGEYEISILIPRRAVNETLQEFLEEVQEFNSFLRVFTELAEGAPTPLVLKTISSSEYQLIVKGSLHIAKIVAESVVKVAAAYKALREIHDAMKLLRKNNAPAEVIKPVEEHAAAKMKQDVDAITVEVMQKYATTITDSHRKAEIENHVRISLSNIAHQIDRGFHINVALPPSPTQTADDPAKAKEVAIEFAELKKNSELMDFNGSTGGPILLSPPEKSPNPPQDQPPK